MTTVAMDDRYPERGDDAHAMSAAHGDPRATSGGGGGGAPGAKICAVCGADASKVKRVKDRAGRYYCATCYVAMAQRRGFAVRFPDVATVDATQQAPPRAEGSR